MSNSGRTSVAGPPPQPYGPQNPQHPNWSLTPAPATIVKSDRPLIIAIAVLSVVAVVLGVVLATRHEAKTVTAPSTVPDVTPLTDSSNTNPASSQATPTTVLPVVAAPATQPTAPAAVTVAATTVAAAPATTTPATTPATSTSQPAALFTIPQATRPRAPSSSTAAGGPPTTTDARPSEAGPVALVTAVVDQFSTAAIANDAHGMNATLCKDFQGKPFDPQTEGSSDVQVTSITQVDQPTVRGKRAVDVVRVEATSRSTEDTSTENLQISLRRESAIWCIFALAALPV